MTLDEWQKDAREEIIEIRKLLDDGMLSLSEYDELVNDILDLEKLDSLADFEGKKILAQKIIEGLSAFARIV